MERSEAILEIQAASKSFGGVIALENVSFRTLSGQILALIGPNGAGKTTLLNIIAGTMPASSGQVLFQGQSLSGRPPHRRVEMGIARTFQQALIFDQMTVLENVMVGCHLRGQSELLAAAVRSRRSRREEEDILLEAMRFLNLVGLGSKADQAAVNLPFGQRRLLAIARAMASNPTLMLLDEPAAGLNRMEKNDLAELVQRIQQMGITVLLVEHDMELVMRLADWVVVLDHGKRLAQGTPSEVRRNQEVISAYLGKEAS